MMKKLFLLLFLSFTSLSVYAKWVFIGEAENFITFVDTESYKKTGSIVRFWELRDYKEPRGIKEINKLYLSSKIKREINCNTEESMMLAIIDYSDNSGNGEVINSFQYNDKQFDHIVADTLGYKIYKFVCNKK